MTAASRRAISAFVVVWLLVFHYESLRRNFLDPWLGTRLPKVKLLFPPAGWIMFFRIDEGDGRAEVWGVRGDSGELIDPHRIFENRWIGYDNIRRNILIAALNEAYAPAFCSYLRRKLPEYGGFLVMQTWRPSVVREPDKVLRQVAYRCP